MLEEVINGEKCPFEALAEIKEQMNMLDSLRESIMPYALDQFDKEISGNSKSFKKNGKEFSISSGGKYYYNHSHEWTDYNKKQKEIEAFMSLAAKNKQPYYVDTNTGMTYEAALYVPNKKSISIK